MSVEEIKKQAQEKMEKCINQLHKDLATVRTGRANPLILEKVVVDYYCYSEELAGGQWLTFYKDNIKSIVTHEQFTSLEYKVEEK